MITKIIRIIILIVVFAGGFMLGGYFLRDTQPRSYLPVKQCEQCWASNEIAGLLESVGITKAPGLIPEIIMETDEAIVVKHPFPQSRIHFVVFPKKDIKDISDVTQEDARYALGAFSLLGELVRENN